jgi:hypothetical protein
MKRMESKPRTGAATELSDDGIAPLRVMPISFFCEMELVLLGNRDYNLHDIGLLNPLAPEANHTAVRALVIAKFARK